MASLEILIADTLFRLSNLGWSGIIDLLLVAAVIYLVIQAIQRSQAAFMLRGALFLGLLLLVIAVLLPLPTFDWLVRGVLLVMLVATPVVLQPELRRLLEQIGRRTGLARAVRRASAQTVLSRLLAAVELLADQRTGALIVLEGTQPLTDIRQTGIPVGGQISPELMQTIFFEKTPLHDGAVIIRDNQIVAASCLLPLTDRAILSYRRLGTRHRAAVGLSEVSDGLVIVVSEETGHISVAQNGRLHQRLSLASLAQKIREFYEEDASKTSTVTLSEIWRNGLTYLRQPARRPALGQMVFSVMITAVITLTLWTYVIEQTNPTERPQIEGIPLRVTDLPPGMALLSTPPTAVAADVQTTADRQAILGPEDFQAVISLAGMEPGIQRIQVSVNANLDQVTVVNVNPPLVTVELAAITSRTLPVSLSIPDREQLSPAYELAGEPTLTPAAITLTGPTPLLAQVSQVQATLSIAAATAPLRQTRPLRALDENGREISGITIEPAQVDISAIISRRRNARDVGVRVLTTGSPPEGYWLSGLGVTPATVTLQGAPDVLEGLNGFADTLPVAVDEAVGEFTIQIPLDLPPDVSAVDANGAQVLVVTAVIKVSARTSDLLLTRPIELIGLREGVTAVLEPQQLDLLLSGPLPILRRIESEPELVQLLVDVARLAPIPGQSFELTPQVLAPEGVTVQFIPPTILVSMSRE